MQPRSDDYSTEPRFDGMDDDLRFNPPEIERVAPPSIFGPRQIEQAAWPVHCLPGTMARAVAAASLLNERPAPMSATVSLVIAAGVLGGDWRYHTERRGSQPISLFSVISAIPGQGKSETIRLFRSPLSGAEKNLTDAYRHAKEVWSSKTTEEKRADPSIRPRVEEPDLLCNNATIQALTRKLARGRPAMIQIMTEGAMLTGGWSGGKDNRTETLANYNSLWDAEGIDVLRVQDGSSYKAAAGRMLSKVVMGQRMMLDWVLDPKSAFGYTARVLLCNDDGEDLEPLTGDVFELQYDVRRFNDVISAVLRAQDKDLEYEHTPPWPHRHVFPSTEAEAFLEDVRVGDRILTGPDLREDELDMKAQWQRRRAHHATRIAAVLTAFEAAEQGMSTDVSFYLDRAEAAVEIANWYHTELCRLVDMSGDTEVAADAKLAWGIVVEHIRHCEGSGKPDDSPNVREVLRMRMPFRKDPERKDRVIARLETDGAIGRMPPEPGKKSARWNVYWRWS